MGFAGGGYLYLFQWFNPASWLLKQELQNIHEYEADETVIEKGVDAKQYQLLLIKKLSAQGSTLWPTALITVNLKTYHYDVKRKIESVGKIEVFVYASSSSYCSNSFCPS